MKTHLLGGLLACIVGASWAPTPVAMGQERGVHVRAPFVAVDVVPPWHRRFIVEPELRMSRILGSPVRNAGGERLGIVKDVIFGVRSGQVRYAAVSPENLPAVGDGLLAVPWHALRWQSAEGGREECLLLDADKETLRDFPRIRPNGRLEYSQSN